MPKMSELPPQADPSQAAQVARYGQPREEGNEAGPKKWDGLSGDFDRLASACPADLSTAASRSRRIFVCTTGA